MPCKLFSGHPEFSNLEILIHKFYQSNEKLLLLGVSNPLNKNNIKFLNEIGTILDHYFKKG